ncbi:hypothetical protein LTR86_010665 [Recurvomyces mirabilis]|nr:hypothetical protein LTR86_010665 [Recurvomyces mirabilis]
MPHTDTELLRPPQVLALPNLKSRCVLTIVTERRSYISGDHNPYLQDEEEQVLVCKGYIEPTASLNHLKDPMLGTGLRRPVTVKLFMPQHVHSSVRAFKDVAALSYALRRRKGKAADIPEVLATVHKHPDGVDRSLRDVIGDFWPSVLHFVIFEFMPPENPCEDPGELLVPVTSAGFHTRGRSRSRAVRDPLPIPARALPPGHDESPLGMRDRLRKVMNVFQPVQVQPKKHGSSVGAGYHLKHKTVAKGSKSPHTPKYDEDDDDGSLSPRSRDRVYTPSAYGSPPQRVIPTDLLNEVVGYEKAYKASVAICGTPLALAELDVSLT